MKLVSEWEKSLQAALTCTDTGIPEKVAKSVPVVPVGYAKELATNCNCDY